MRGCGRHVRLAARHRAAVGEPSLAFEAAGARLARREGVVGRGARGSASSAVQGGGLRVDALTLTRCRCRAGAARGPGSAKVDARRLCSSGVSAGLVVESRRAACARRTGARALQVAGDGARAHQSGARAARDCRQGRRAGRVAPHSPGDGEGAAEAIRRVVAGEALRTLTAVRRRRYQRQDHHASTIHGTTSTCWPWDRGSRGRAEPEHQFSEYEVQPEVRSVLPIAPRKVAVESKKGSEGGVLVLGPSGSPSSGLSLTLATLGRRWVPVRVCLDDERERGAGGATAPTAAAPPSGLMAEVRARPAAVSVRWAGGSAPRTRCTCRTAPRRGSRRPASPGRPGAAARRGRR
jgi:hypothetical protein